MKDFWFALLLVTVWQFIAYRDQKASDERLRMLEERVNGLERE